MFGMVTKGQKLKTYSQELKLKAINLKLEGMTKRQISEELGIEHHDRVKVWMRNYKQFGKYGLMNNRGRLDSYKDEDMHLQKLLFNVCNIPHLSEIEMKSTKQLHSRYGHS
jgi:transposase